MITIVPAILIFLALVAVAIGGYNVWVKRATDRETKRLIDSGEMRYFTERRGDGSGPAVLLIHGYGGSPFDLSPLTNRLESMGRAYYAPVLPGHGESPYDMDTVTANDWLATVAEGYYELREQYGEIDVVGFSMGGSLALAEAARLEPRRLVVIAPYFKLYRPPLLPGSVESWASGLSTFIPVVRRMSKGNIRLNDPEGLKEYQAREELAISGVSEVVRTGKLAEAALDEIKCPVLWMHSTEDGMTDYEASQGAFDRLASDHKKFVRFERSAHVILFDYDAEAAVDSIISFLSEISEQ